jgi:FPC/CPF motif-containing protein YcgG
MGQEMMHLSAEAAEHSDLLARIDADFRAFVGDDAFPCLAGKGAVRREDYTLRVYGRLGTVDAARQLGNDLSAFVDSVPEDGAGLRTFVAVFTGTPPSDELEFERCLWRQLQQLHEADAAAGAWDPAVSADPASAEFSFSFGARALFVVGLHPASSRIARRFGWAALAFNPRSQFERLRAEGRFERLRTTVRERDVAIQGTPNPNLADFGEASEARQYSGRATESGWHCPFHHVTK